MRWSAPMVVLNKACASAPYAKATGLADGYSDWDTREKLVTEGSELMESMKLVGTVIEPFVKPAPQKAPAKKKITRKKSKKE